MVYTGKPSRACNNCRNRRIKCDESRPFCGQCKKSGRTCPGYRDEFDLIFRNETSATKRRAQKSASRENETPPKVCPQKASKLPDGSQALEPIKDPEQDDWVFDAFNAFVERSQVALVPGLGVSEEIQATAFFFRNFVLLPRQTDATRGFLSILLPFYNRLGCDSSLHTATTAVALTALANFPDKSYLKHQSATEYGKAIRKVNESIFDPTVAKSDEMLLTILLFGLYETVSSTRRSLEAWTAHVNGAVALAKLRGTEQFNNPVSLNLFRATRAHMLCNAIQHSLPITDFPAANGWLSDSEYQSSAANRLMMTTLRLPAIRQRAKHVFRDPNLWSNRDVLLPLMSSVAALDAELALWYDNLPAIWRPRTVATLNGTPDDIEQSDVWPGPINVYTDVAVSNVLINYRMARLFLQTIVIACIARQAASREAVEKNERYQQAVQKARDMVDGNCAAVPFHLGYDIENKAKKIGRHETTAEAIGGYFLVWPLLICNRVQCIPDEQKRWALGRLKYIARTYGINGLHFFSRFPYNYVNRGIDLVNDPEPDQLNKEPAPIPAGPMITPPIPVDNEFMMDCGRNALLPTHSDRYDIKSPTELYFNPSMDFNSDPIMMGMPLQMQLAESSAQGVA